MKVQGSCIEDVRMSLKAHFSPLRMRSPTGQWSPPHPQLPAAASAARPGALTSSLAFMKDNTGRTNTACKDLYFQRCALPACGVPA
jgi:hypothetical protein